MNDDKNLILRFNSGTEMEVPFPTQVKNSLGAVEVGRRVLASDKAPKSENQPHP